jgi:arylsulfatase A-like enzyme
LSIEEDVVIKRLGSIPPGVYWYVLGKNKISWLPFFLLRVKEALLWRWRRLSNNTFPFPMIIFSHWVSTSREIFDELLLELKKSKNSKQHFHLHVMDVHDCQAFNRPLKKILQFKKLPKWLFARTKNLTNRHFLYDLALMSVDEQIGRLINTLEECNLTDKSAIIISGDHGNSFARSSRGSIDLGLRTYSEYVDIPIVAYNCGKEISVNPDKMRDSMSMSATLLHFMNIKPDVSFLGESIDDKHSRGYVVVESSGSRLFDGPEVDLFLTLATKKYKLMTILKKNILLVKHLYDLIEDPDELIDIAHNKEKRDKIDSLVNILFTERHELFMLKNIKPNAWSLF